MKICIHNFGPISHYEFDLDKDFHLVIGENSVGKSYAHTLVYLIIKSFLRFDFSEFPPWLSEVNSGEPALASFKQLANKQEVDVNEHVAASLGGLLSVMVIRTLQESLLSTFESEEIISNQLSHEPLSIILKSRTVDIYIGYDFSKKELLVDRIVLATDYRLRAILQNRLPRHSVGQVVLYHNVKEPDYITYAYGKLVYQLFSAVVSEVTAQCGAVHYLPAGRSGLYQALSAFGQIIAELSKNRSFLRRKIELPGISEPVSDYFLRLSNISVQKRKSLEGELNNVASRIEKDILRGVVDFDSATKRIMFRPDSTSLRLDLSASSSMVSELAPIVSYFRYVLGAPRVSRGQRKQMVIIEEPEAHLHPRVQVKLVEIFASLVRLGIKVVLTSHSNYVFGKASNLVISGALPKEQIAASLFILSERGSVGRCLNVDKFGIDDENFVDVAEYLFGERAELLSDV